MRSLIWILVCVLIPLVGTTYAMRMMLLSLLPEKFRRDLGGDEARSDAVSSG